MNHARLIIGAGLFCLLLLSAAPSTGYAQTDTTKKSANDTLNSALINEFPRDFDVTFKTVKAALETAGYVVNYSSKKYKRIETDFRQLASEENFNEVMDKYGDVPYMRSPGWTIGRAKLFLSLDPLDTNRTEVKVLAQLSGYEDRFTNTWHYWKSNGKLEEEAMDVIVAAMEALEKK